MGLFQQLAKEPNAKTGEGREGVVNYARDPEKDGQEGYPQGVCAIDRSVTTDEEDCEWESGSASVLA
jgi:hypothetical protein